MNPIWNMARKEFSDGLRNRWLLAISLLFAVLAIGIAWLGALQHEERDRALSDLKVVQVSAGELLCRVGRPATYWFGVIDGLLKMSNDASLGFALTRVLGRGREIPAVGGIIRPALVAQMKGLPA